MDPARTHRILADAARPPLPPSAFGAVALLGNTLGFAGPASDRLWQAATALVAPGGRLLVEIAPGPGERSRYLARLPASSVGRLLEAPLRAVLPRVDREGFATEPVRRKEEGEFRRIPAAEVIGRCERAGWVVRETVAVAPALGADPDRIERAQTHPRAWAHLLELEEEIGRRPARWERAAAVLVAAERPPSIIAIK